MQPSEKEEEEEKNDKLNRKTLICVLLFIVALKRYRFGW